MRIYDGGLMPVCKSWKRRLSTASFKAISRVGPQFNRAASGAPISNDRQSTIIGLHEDASLGGEDRARFAAAVVDRVGRSLFEAQKRKFSKDERSFYGLVLAYGGGLVLKLVTRALYGPSTDTVKRWRHDAPRLRFGTSVAAIEHNLDVAVQILGDYNLLDGTLFILGEDGTSAKKRLDAQLEKVDGSWRVCVYGLGCGALELDSIDHLHDNVLKHGLASTFYALSLIPLAEGAPAIPVAITANNNDFDSPDAESSKPREIRAFDSSNSAFLRRVRRILLGISILGSKDINFEYTGPSSTTPSFESYELR